MSFPLINPAPQFFDSSGAPLAGGTIEFKSPTTNEYINTYPTADDADAQTDANDNPLTLNARGEAPDGIYLEDGVKYRVILKDPNGATIWDEDDVRCPQYTVSVTTFAMTAGTNTVSMSGKPVVSIVGSPAYTRNATIVEDRTLLASASATTLNNNNVLAALIADLQARGLIN